MKAVTVFTLVCFTVSVFIQLTEQCPNSTAKLKRRNYRREAKNKELVLDFMQRVFGDKDFDAIEEYTTEDYIQHSHDLADGREGVREAVTNWLKDVPKRDSLDIKRVAADGDLVWLHLRMDFTKWGGTDEAIVDIFRIEDGLIAEHWDVLQTVPMTPSRNNNTVF